MRESYFSYAMSVIASRALPDVRDGLKPVQRRILYAMREMNLTPDKQHRKCAGVIGEVLKNYHPHGDSSVYDALVRMAQDFTLRYPLIDPHGNFGSIDGDRPAAYRYTEARLARIAMEMLADIDKDTVDFIPNFDSQGTEPRSRCRRSLPQLLVNGSSGIAVGMATNIPPHNIGEISDAIAYLVDHEDDAPEDLDRRHLQTSSKVPTFRPAASPMGREAIRQAYPHRSRLDRDARQGRDRRRAAACHPHRHHRSALPSHDRAHRRGDRRSARSKRSIVGISSLQNESDRKGTRIVVELARSATPGVVLNLLYKHTPLQSSFGFNMLALAAGALRRFSGMPQPRSSRRCSRCARCSSTSSPTAKTVIRRRTEYDLQSARTRAHPVVVPGGDVNADGATKREYPAGSDPASKRRRRGSHAPLSRLATATS